MTNQQEEETDLVSKDLTEPIKDEAKSPSFLVVAGVGVILALIIRRLIKRGK